MGETFYDVLGVGREASQEDIEAAYRERVKETHPDLNDSPDATDAFQRVQTAEEVLGDPDERARYDRLGHRSYTSHFGAQPAEGGSGWDFGSDRSAEEAHDDADGGSGWGGDGSASGSTDDGFGDDGGFGFDPGAYDRTNQHDGDGNPSERSYDVSDGSDDSDGVDEEADGATASASAGASDAGASGGVENATAGGGVGAASGASASAAAGAGASGVGDWQERARRTQRQWSKAAQREGRGASSDDDGGYSVHDWNDEELETESTRYSLQGSEMVVVGIMFILYPFIAFSTIAPQFSLFVNVVVGLCALALTGYLLTMPRIGFFVFGAWSVIAPAVFLAVPGLEIVSLVGLVMLGTTWIPFGYSILFLYVLD